MIKKLLQPPPGYNLVDSKAQPDGPQNRPDGPQNKPSNREDADPSVGYSVKP